MILICILKIQANLKLGKQIANLIIISIVNQICFIGLPVCQKYQTKIASALGMYSVERVIPPHTAYSWNIMCQKWEGDCGLWVSNEIILKKYVENLKKIVGAVWELPAK